MAKINPKSIFAISKKEFLDNIRNKWIILLTVIFVLLIVIFSYVAGGGPGGRHGRFARRGGPGNPGHTERRDVAAGPAGGPRGGREALLAYPNGRNGEQRARLAVWIRAEATAASSQRRSRQDAPCLSELRTKHAAASSRNGVVGSKGTNTPIKPSPTEVAPRVTNVHLCSDALLTALSP